MKLVLCLLLTLALSSAADSGIDSFVTGSNEFTSSIYSELTKENNKNFLVSPFSAELLLALLQAGAVGDTGTEIRSALDLPETQDATNSLIKSVLPTFDNAGYQLHTANKIYVGSNFALNDNFKAVAVETYNSEVEAVDFQNTNSAVTEINAWVSDETNGKIPQFVGPDDIPPTTKAFLVNALYFHGNWSTPFNPFDLKQAVFYGMEEYETNLSDFLYVYSNRFNYTESEELDAQILELPFEVNDASMVFVLPKQRTGVTALDQKSAAFLSDIKFTESYIQVAIPKFKIESSLVLNSALKSLGIVKALDPAQADFSGIGGSVGDFTFETIFQKTFIEVTELGVEAAAATGTGHITGVDPSPRYFFTADHPFEFYIQVNGVVLFEGRVYMP